MNRWVVVLLGGAGVLSGCGTLLPHSRDIEVSPFASFEAARDALERVRPYRTTVAELRGLGFDTGASANVQQLPYPQWIGQLVHPGVPMEHVDVGIRDCIAAAQGCLAYRFRYAHIMRERRGAFMADFLNFRRVTYTHGWRFEAVVLVRGDQVLFRNHGGQPKVEQIDDRTNPLGPAQALGEGAVRAMTN